MKALKITKGKPFSSGVVFIDGKFIEPPYVVERYGNVLRINKIQVINPLIDWSEFLKTQSGVVVTKTEPAPVSAPEPAPEPVEATPITADDDGDDPLADLFDDSPAKPKKTSRKSTAHHSSAPKPVAPKTTVSLSGDFEMNAKASMMVNRLNAQRTEIDASLRRGCFFCFGSNYSRVNGDKGSALRILQQVPKIMKDNSDYAEFAAAMRKAGFVYFPPNLVKEMFVNRVDYLLLQKRWKKVFEEQEFNAMLENAGVNNY